MLNLIILGCILGGTIAAAIQVPKLRRGWVHPKFAADPVKFRVNKRKEYAIMAGSALFCGALFLALGTLEDRRPAAIERYVIGGVALACGIAGLWLRTLLPRGKDA